MGMPGAESAEARDARGERGGETDRQQVAWFTRNQRLQPPLHPALRRRPGLPQGRAMRAPTPCPDERIEALRSAELANQATGK